MNDELVIPEDFGSADGKRKAPGRPKLLTGEAQNLIVQLDADLHAKLKSYCGIRRVKMSVLVRGWIEDFLGREADVELLGVQDRLEDWMKDYKKIPGATLEQVLEKFRQLQEEQKKQYERQRAE